MHLFTSLFTIPALVAVVAARTAPASSPSRLWATHYNGNVYTLTFADGELRLTDTLKTCGGMPSWLTFDPETRVLYCSDESGSADPSAQGSLSAYRAAGDGALTQIATTRTVGGGVNSVIFEAGDRKFLAIAH